MKLSPSNVINVYRDYAAEHRLMSEFILARPPASGAEFLSDELPELETKAINITLKFTFDTDGQRKIDGFAGVIEMFQDTRLRLCVVKDCSRAFYAKRANPETCSTKCV